MDHAKGAAINAISSLQRFPLGLRIENAIVSYGLYLWKMLWPSRLAVLYPFPAIAIAGRGNGFCPRWS